MIGASRICSGLFAISLPGAASVVHLYYRFCLLPSPEMAILAKWNERPEAARP